MSEIGGIGSNVAVERARVQLNTDTKTYDTSSEAVADFGKQKSSGTDEIQLSKTDVKTVTENLEKATSNVQSLTKAIGDMTSHLEGLAAEYNVANTNGDNDASKIKSELDKARNELEAKKVELEQAKNNEATSKSDKQTAEMTLQKLECKLQGIEKQLAQTEKTNSTDKTTMDASQVNLTQLEQKALEEAKTAEEAKKAEEAQKSEEATPKEKMTKAAEEAGYDAEIGSKLMEIANQKNGNGVSKDLCAMGTREALNELGIDYGIPGSAGEALKVFQEDPRFTEISNDSKDQKNVPEGTIMFCEPKGDKKDGSIHEYGHMAVIGYDRDESGNIKRDENGDPILVEISDHKKPLLDRSNWNTHFFVINEQGNAEIKGANGNGTGIPTDGVGTGVPVDGKGIPDPSYKDGTLPDGNRVPMEEEPFVNRASYRDGTGNVGSTTGGDGKVGSGKPEDDRLAGGDAVVGASVDGTLPVIGGDVEGVALDHAEPTVSSGTFKIGAFNTYEQARAADAANQNDSSIRNSGQKAMDILHGTGKIATDVPVGNFHADVENIPESLLSVMKDSNGDFTASGLYDMDMKSDTSYKEKKSVFIPTGGSSGYTTTQYVNHAKIDNVITSDELEKEISQLSSKKDLKPAEQNRLNACQDLLTLMKENNKTSFDNNMFRELIIDASKTGKNVNFLDVLK